MALPPETIAAIHAWQEAGNLAVATTGKSLTAANFALEPYDLSFDYSVLFTGAVIAHGNEIVSHRSLDSDVVREVASKLADVDGVAVYATTLHGRDARLSCNLDTSYMTHILHEFVDMGIEDIDDHEFIGVPIWVPDDNFRAEVAGWIQSTFPVECALNQTFIDIIPEGCTKGSGLQELAAKLGNPSILTFGDSWNDISMHRIADQAFSFPWSPPEVQAVSTVTNSVAEVLNRI